MEAKKYVYLFAEGSKDMRNLLGGKGANLAEMTNIGLPVPPGLTITTECCKEYLAAGNKIPEGLEEQLMEKLAALEEKMGKKFGDENNPLLVSVRSGAPVSMPGMMDTILNLGLNDKSVLGLARVTNDERFAKDCYRRFIQMFSDVVLGVESIEFENVLERVKSQNGLEHDYQLTPEMLENIIEEFKKIVRLKTGSDFPQEPKKQLMMAVEAVFNSWNNDRAKVYRKINNIPDDLGTAVNVQTMVFGNMGEDCGTGVAFTRNPSTGEDKIYGEFLINAQGEDVVAGIRTPLPIDELKSAMPKIYEEFEEICEKLEAHYRDMQDIEFTIEKGKLYILQTRSGKRTASAAVKIAVDMVNEGLITKEEAIMRIEPKQLENLMHSRIDPDIDQQPIAKGLPASPGAATGAVVFDADEAEELANKEGAKVILVRTETTPDDIHGMVAAQGVLTSRGGMTSHAAVVARGMGKPAVVGCDAIKIDYANEKFFVGGEEFSKGDIISIDGGTGNVYKGEVPMYEPELGANFETLLSWADELARVKVRANADTPEDARRAREFGAVGIGLVRTEHMFMEGGRLAAMQEMILADTREQREAALAKILPYQREDFYGILKEMAGLPVTIRLLDPPLHEFLPNLEELLVEITKLRCTNGDPELLKEKEALLRTVRGLSELNPMLGHRGCRLGIHYPEIYAMQLRAIFEATAKLVKEGYEVYPEIEMPLVIHENEQKRLRAQAVEVAEQVKKETGVDFPYKVGVMLEVPRACLVADKIAKESDFFSFGTNDLTQMGLGVSRDDAQGKFLHTYVSEGIFEHDPFIVIDREAVGELMRIAITKARSIDPKFEFGICGEHGGEPNSIEFCHLVGLDYVSVSPYRVPVSRLCCAQAAIKHKDK
ncbi:MAG: pyruvate, phosphate dikinase [Clostridia bacterium]|nr:pyruvate, phosphate dikinase [Clostridia bacterium]